MIKDTENMGGEKYTAPKVVNITQKIVSRAEKPFSKVLQELSWILVGTFLFVILFTYLFNMTVWGGSISIKDITIQTILLAVCSVAVRSIMLHYGVSKGEQTPKWVETQAKIQENVKTIIDNHFQAIATKYCEKWVEDEFKERLQAILDYAKVSLSDYNTTYKILTKKELQQREELTKIQKKLLLMANRQKKLSYSPDFLTNDDCASSISPKASPDDLNNIRERTIKMRKIKMITTTLITSIIVGSVVLEIINNISWATFLMAVFKVVWVLILGFLEMESGYNITSKVEVDAMKFKNKEQENFISFAKNYVPPVVEVVEEKQEPAEPVKEMEAVKVEEVKAEPVKVEEIQHTA